MLVRLDDEDGYEMISGHRRMHAAPRLGIETIPAIVKEMTDDESTIAMVNANIQREELLSSEKAYAYKMKLEEMKKTTRLSEDALKLFVKYFDVRHTEN